MNTPTAKNTFFQSNRTSFTAAAGVASRGAITLLTRDNLTGALDFALYCFAIATPLNAACLLVQLTTPQVEDLSRTRLALGAGIVGQLSTFIGVSAVFVHFSWGVGTTFILSSLFALVIWCWELNFHGLIEDAEDDTDKQG